ncbi:hypothetical protein [Okeania sp. SIO2G5]|uniref:hypothetical protein n=1 Tax=Okeania sp. SIO2G5 TaxID=2607796 RepID=UPI00338E929E
MSYSSFKSIGEICDRFNVTLEESSDLFSTISPAEVSPLFQQLLERNIPLAMPSIPKRPDQNY